MKWNTEIFNNLFISYLTLIILPLINISIYINISIRISEISNGKILLAMQIYTRIKTLIELPVIRLNIKIFPVDNITCMNIKEILFK